MNIAKVLTGCTFAGGIALMGAAGAVAAPTDTTNPTGAADTVPLVPFDQATVIDWDDVVFAKGGVLTADGTNLCSIDPYRYVFADRTYPCFIGFGESPGQTAPTTFPVLVPFEQATVVDPQTITLVQGGVIAADGTNLCTANPGNIVFPDGRYPCFIDFDQTFTTVPGPALPVPQVAQVPVGGADTGVPSAGSGPPDRGLTATVAALAVAAGAAVAALPVLRRRLMAD
ncbi:hypothetical protein [Arthrobacter sp. CAN_A1]|uniref:hypothetical protein n=1 Tax=Arthrobacter sp. CAN_A1 TaxID=2787717 RepID=UPI0018C9F2B7